MNMEFERKLAIPAEVKERYPLTAKINDIVEKKRAEIKAVFEGRSDKMILLIGPCSADREDAVIDYMTRLVPVQEKVKDKSFLYRASIPTNRARQVMATRACFISRIQIQSQICTRELLQPVLFTCMQ